MMDLELILDGFSIFTLVKWIMVFGLVVYAFFSFLIMRQIKVMNSALKVRKEVFVYIAGVAHFVMALLVLFLAITVL